MVLCNGKINDYSDTKGQFDFLDIYDFLTYKFYNNDKKLKIPAYITYLKKNQELETKIKVPKSTNYKKLMLKMEYILNQRINDLRQLKTKIHSLFLIKKSYSNYKNLQINKSLSKDNLIITKRFQLELLEGNLNIPNKEEYSLYKHLNEFFNITTNDSEQLISNNKFKKQIIINNNKLLKKINENIDQELKKNLNIQTIINKRKDIYYISPYTNYIDKNQLNVIINNVNKEKKRENDLRKYITEKAYPIVRPIVKFNGNIPIELTTVYSPKVWKIDNLEKVYNEALIYIKINYLFNINNQKDLNKFTLKVANFNCKTELKEQYFNCLNNLSTKQKEKGIFENRMLVSQNILLNIYNNYSNLFDETIFSKKFIFSTFLKNKNNKTLENSISKSFVNKNQDDIIHELLFQSENSILYTLFKKCLNTDNGDKEKNLLNKLIKTLNNSNKKLNNNLQDLIVFKFSNLIEKIFERGDISKNYDEEIVLNKRKKKFIKFSQRNLTEINKFKNMILTVKHLQKKLDQNKNTTVILDKINNIDKIVNKIKQYEIQLLIDGKNIVKHLNKDVIFLKKINNFITTFLNDLVVLKQGIKTKSNNFKKIIENVLIKQPPNLELTKETLETLDGVDLKLDYFQPDTFFILLSYINDIQSSNLVKNIYNLFINIPKMKLNANPNFECFLDIQSILEASNKDFDYKTNIWMWTKDLDDNWKKKDQNIINERKSFLKSYPYVFTKTSELRLKTNNLSPCILNWLTEDEIIYMEMAKNFQRNTDNESLNLFLNTIDVKKIKSLTKTYELFFSISKFFENLANNTFYDQNHKIIYKCFKPNIVKIENPEYNTLQWKNILKLYAEIETLQKEVLINSLIQASSLEMLKTIILNKKNKPKKKNISYYIFIEKILHYIMFLYEIQTLKYMTKKELKKEKIQKDTAIYEYHPENDYTKTNSNIDIVSLDDLF